MDVITVFKKVVTDHAMKWVLFKRGTCVMLLNPEEDARAQAVKILKDHGSVVAGTPSGDFEVTKIPEIDGWIVTGEYPGIMAYVSEAEAGSQKSDVDIGLIGRSKRDQDSKELEVIHVEDKGKRK
ncbi:hypothetical protein A2973_05265 [Candidatus Gottesmanbacteria bacterium RIFCSPLOWO2_01_FULL_49_10]|uniref:Uncharacterized protein n=1 Tax=Candidatus Gottesmanbacteria bacterium RIFCSPLOWO2_01_FULL_49_10 TaxID=1798396 RepID=A0A1F6AZC1_9BACT|nr:MAG: hypothetical protein A2973_05265 [Candidatus Gottesmanbacteria bacterium RIFCSPLOWO2_01_FULL_49_10]